MSKVCRKENKKRLSENQIAFYKIVAIKNYFAITRAISRTLFE